MALALEHFFCCLDLKLGGIIMAWWGMVISAISIVSCVLALIAGDRGGYINYLPLHVVTSNGLISAILTILILVIYFYFSYQLLLGAQGGNAGQMVGYLIIHGVVVVLFILAAFDRVYSVVGAILYLYLWVCVYSLYVKSGGSTII